MSQNGNESPSSSLKALSESAERNKKLYQYDEPDSVLLERFKNPALDSPFIEDHEFVISIKVPEFTSLCPLTGQPDFATILIDYVPGIWCVESKSLKLYMLTYRQHGEFHEGCVQRMLNDLVTVLNPKWMRIEGQFTPRGGIPFWPTATYGKRG